MNLTGKLILDSLNFLIAFIDLFGYRLLSALLFGVCGGELVMGTSSTDNSGLCDGLDPNSTLNGFQTKISASISTAIAAFSSVF